MPAKKAKKSPAKKRETTEQKIARMVAEGVQAALAGGATTETAKPAPKAKKVNVPDLVNLGSVAVAPDMKYPGNLAFYPLKSDGSIRTRKDGSLVKPKRLRREAVAALIENADAIAPMLEADAAE